LQSLCFEECIAKQFCSVVVALGIVSDQGH